MKGGYSRSICFITALPSEARPVRHHFRLERDHRFNDHPVYRRPPFSLVISGTGRRAAFDAVSWSERAGLASENDTWINLGIGGHKTHPLGQVVLADEVVEPSSGKRWSCDAPYSDLWKPGRVMTLDAPAFEYREDALYDMEAAGFIEAVERIAPLRRSFCFKIVSDSADHDASEINGRLVSHLIGASIPALDRLLKAAESRE